MDDIIPPLLLVLRTSTLPTSLRSSSLTILATSIETAPLAMMPYVNLLLQACLDLLSLESRPIQPRRAKEEAIPSNMKEGDESEEEELIAPQLDRNGRLKRPEETPVPTANDSRHPSLRRAAILFLAMLFRVAANLEVDSSSAGYDSHNPLQSFTLGGSKPNSSTSDPLVSGEQRRKTKILLKYLAEVDEDSLVRYQAAEVLEEI